MMLTYLCDILRLMLVLFIWCCLWPLPLVLVLHRIIALVAVDVHAGRADFFVLQLCR